MIELDIEIEVKKIKDIKTSLVRDQLPYFKINTTLTEYLAEELFYKLWDKFEDQWLIKCLEREGYKLIKNE